jgi:glycosyltransferase involved in cell wall biosynthesis
MNDLLKYKLVVAGSSGWLSKKIINEIEHIEFRDNILSINFIDDEDKEYVYNLASIFVYSSFFEGFGFPVLEAMRCGIPIICSNNSSIPEIAGPGAILIDPHKPSQIVYAFKEILTNRDKVKKVINIVLNQANKFDWKRTSKNFLSSIKN